MMRFDLRPRELSMRLGRCSRAIFLPLSFLLFFATYSTAQDSDPSKITFEDGTRYSEIRFVHQDETAGDNYLPHLMVAGAGMFDYDNDGCLDLLLLNGLKSIEESPARTAAPDSKPARSTLNLERGWGDGRFSDVSRYSRLNQHDLALGTASADIDNDGFADIVISNFGPLRMFHNNGDGTFDEVSASMEVTQSSDFGAGVAFLDVDSDGVLDLYAARYVQFSFQRHRAVAPKSFPYPPGPKDFPPATDRLFRSDGEGRFQDWSVAAGIADHPGPSMGVIAGDWDQDGDSDVFVCNDASPNQMFINDGHGHFTEAAAESGTALDARGNANGSMGVDAGDYDSDGLIDLIITNYTGQVPVLYRNLGLGLFEDAGRRARVGRELLPHTNWGVGFIDFDNDRDPDLFFANGHFLKNVSRIDDRTGFKVPNALYVNDGEGRFADQSVAAGGGMSIVESSRGTVFGDIDGDGDTDCVVLNAGAPPSVLVNRSKPLGHWIDLRLIGIVSNRDAVGAVVTLLPSSEVTGMKKIRTAMVHAGRGYQSHYGTILHFGLGDDVNPIQASVRWPSGQTETFEIEAVDRTVILFEGTGR